MASSEATWFRFGEKYFTMGRDVDSPVVIAVVQAVARSELPGFGGVRVSACNLRGSVCDEAPAL